MSLKLGRSHRWDDETRRKFFVLVVKGSSVRAAAVSLGISVDLGAKFTSWAFTDRIRSAGLMSSFGTVGDELDNVMMESLLSSKQIELLNGKPWKSRVELSNALFE